MIRYDCYCNHPQRTAVKKPFVVGFSKNSNAIHFIYLKFIFIVCGRSSISVVTRKSESVRNDHLAYSMARFSRITFTLIWPGKFISSSILRAILRAKIIAFSSSSVSSSTMMRTSLPACNA